MIHCINKLILVQNLIKNSFLLQMSNEKRYKKKLFDVDVSCTKEGLSLAFERSAIVNFKCDPCRPSVPIWYQSLFRNVENKYLWL